MRLVKIREGEFKGRTGVVLFEDDKDVHLKIKGKPDPITIKKKLVKFLNVASWIIDKLLMILKIF